MLNILYEFNKFNRKLWNYLQRGQLQRNDEGRGWN